MKYARFFLTFCMAFFFFTNMHSQEQSAFSSFGVSLSATTTGAEFELATPLHEKVVLRGGFSFLPYNFETSVNVRKVNEHDLPMDVPVDMDGKIRNYNGKIVLDYFPSTDVAFFISGGLYLGNQKIVTMEGKSDEDLIWGNHIIPSENGQVKALVKANSAKPYLGIGFGNTIPQKRVGFRFELGAMFQGTPRLHNTKGDELDDININDADIIDLVKKFKVYPVVAFRLTGRLF